ncbi:RusA family crossover junction endodeoxyribonuclease [Chryseobacterium sp. DT-3]|uniref:RusA family crossover junction endodeoxyribonuclease n=1 Tax=Chryseobacterium sp. DT-3 TaxID=3396164 RepID=UPI003F19D9FA
MLEFEIIGIPKPKQSARFRISKNKLGQQFIASYQKKDIKDYEQNIKAVVTQFLPKDFIIYDCAISMNVEYVFPALSSMSKKEKDLISSGVIIYKTTKPDLSDNLNKGLVDSLAGLVYTNDSRISVISAVKYYGPIPKTIVKIEKL